MLDQARCTWVLRPSVHRHDIEGKGSLTFKQIWSATETNRNVFDPTGWTAEKLEWIVTWCVAKCLHSFPQAGRGTGIQWAHT